MVLTSCTVAFNQLHRCIQCGLDRCHCQAEAAIDTLSETELDGRPILVREDRER